MRKRRRLGRKEDEEQEESQTDAMPPMCPRCPFVRTATYVSTFGVFLCWAVRVPEYPPISSKCQTVGAPRGPQEGPKRGPRGPQSVHFEGAQNEHFGAILRAL